MSTVISTPELSGAANTCALLEGVVARYPQINTQLEETCGKVVVMLVKTDKEIILRGSVAPLSWETDYKGKTFDSNKKCFVFHLPLGTDFNTPIEYKFKECISATEQVWETRLDNRVMDLRSSFFVSCEIINDVKFA